MKTDIMRPRKPGKHRRHRMQYPTVVNLRSKKSAIKELQKSDNFNLAYLKQAHSNAKDLGYLSNDDFNNMSVFITEKSNEIWDWYMDSQKLNKLSPKMVTLIHDILYDNFKEYKDGYDEEVKRKDLMSYHLETLEKYYDDKTYKAFKGLNDEHKFTADQLDNLDLREIKLESKSSESISSLMHTSTWTTYLNASVIIDGKKFTKNDIWFNSDTNRL